MHSTTLLLRT